MTISSPAFTRLQSGVTAADDLRVRGPVNAALAWLSGGLVNQLNTQFSAVSNSISSALAAFRGTANTWSAAQTTTLATAGTAGTWESTDPGGGTGPILDLYRNSATPAANDLLGALLFTGKDSAGNKTTYSSIIGFLSDPSDASEDASMIFQNIANGTAQSIIILGAGLRVGNPTGGDMGLGTLNMDNAIYRDGTQVVGARVTGYGNPFGAVSRATFSTTTVTTAALASFVAAMYTDLKAHGLIGN